MKSEIAFWSFLTALTALFGAGIVTVANMVSHHGVDRIPALFISAGGWAILIGLAWAILLRDETGDLGPLNQLILILQFAALIVATLILAIPFCSQTYHEWLPTAGVAILILATNIVIYGVVLFSTMLVLLRGQDRYRRWKYRSRYQRPTTRNLPLG